MRASSATGATAAARHLFRDRIRVLAYHAVPDLEFFRCQVEHLIDRYHPIGISDLHDSLHRGHQLPARSVLITFDDGDESVYTNGLPVLTELQVPAVAYVITSLIDTDRPTWWHEVETLVSRRGVSTQRSASLIAALKRLPDVERRERIADLRDDEPVRQRQLSSENLRVMQGSGITIGNHTVDHPCLNRCSADAAEEQVRTAHATLTERLGAPPDSFAYPNGDVSDAAKRTAVELGYRSAMLFDHRLQTARPTLTVSRVRADARSTVRELEWRLSGLHPALVSRGSFE